MTVISYDRAAPQYDADTHARFGAIPRSGRADFSGQLRSCNGCV